VTETIITSVLFISLTVVFCLFFWFRYKMRKDMQNTIRTAIDKGQELTPDLIDRLGTPKRAKDRDLRSAIIGVALAVALVVFGYAIPEDSNEAQQAFLGIAAFPFFVGLGYLIMWRFTGQD